MLIWFVNGYIRLVFKTIILLKNKFSLFSGALLWVCFLLMEIHKVMLQNLQRSCRSMTPRPSNCAQNLQLTIPSNCLRYIRTKRILSFFLDVPYWMPLERSTQISARRTAATEQLYSAGLFYFWFLIWFVGMLMDIFCVSMTIKRKIRPLVYNLGK